MLQVEKDIRHQRGGLLENSQLEDQEIGGRLRFKGKKVKAVCGSYSTAALRHIVLLPE